VTRFLRVAVLVLTIAAAAPAAAAPAGDRQTASVRVYFLQGEQLVAVTRTGSTVKAAVTALLAILAAERAAARTGTECSPASCARTSATGSSSRKARR
jgi:hypothetical protein